MRTFRVSPVLALLLHRCPSHVARLIVSVVIRIAVNGMLGRWFATQYLKELLKRFKAKLDSTSAVSRKRFVARVCASRFCGIKGDIFGRWFRIPVCVGLSRLIFAVSPSHFAVTVLGKTSAGSRAVGFKVSGCDGFDDSAVALTEPVARSFPLASVSENYKASDPVAGQVLKTGIDWMGGKLNVKILNRHFDLRYRLKCLEGLCVFQHA